MLGLKRTYNYPVLLALAEKKLNPNHRCYKGMVMMVITMIRRTTIRISITIAGLFDTAES
jgi:hypothetical protein